MKIGPHLPKLLSNKRGILYWDTVHSWDSAGKQRRPTVCQPEVNLARSILNSSISARSLTHYNILQMQNVVDGILTAQRSGLTYVMAISGDSLYFVPVCRSGVARGGFGGFNPPPHHSHRSRFFHSRKVTAIKYYNVSLTTRRTINSHNLRKTNHLGRVVRLLAW